MDSELERDLRYLLEGLERNLALPDGFYFELERNAQSDWAFVIELQVLVEAALSLVIVKTLGDARVGEHVRRLSMTGAGGKVRLACALGILTPEGAAVCERLAAIRNSFAHDLKWIRRTLQEFGDSLLPDKRRDFVRVFGPFGPEQPDVDELTAQKRFSAGLRLSLWFAVANVLATIGTAELEASARAVEREANAALAARLKNQSTTITLADLGNFGRVAPPESTILSKYDPRRTNDLTADDRRDGES